MRRLTNPLSFLRRNEGGVRPRRSARPARLALERLEGRALLSAAPSVLSRTGTIDGRGGRDTVLMQVEPGQYTAPASGKLVFEVELAGADGSKFVPGSFQVLGPDGGRVAESAATRSSGSLFRRVTVAPGDYTVRVAALGRSTGAFVVSVHMAGDVDGDREVDQADLDAVRAAEGERKGRGLYSGPLDVNNNRVINALDFKLARSNLGAQGGKTFRFNLTNGTNGAFNPDNSYVAILGNFGGKNVRLDSSGNQNVMTEADNTRGDSITRNGLVYTPSYSMKLSTLMATGIPVGELNSGRIWIGLGSPVYFHVFPDGGFTQPDVSNASDPNAATNFDFTEFTLDNGGIHANTSQVDAFDIPLTMNIVGDKDQTVGITEARSALFAAFPGAVPAEFKGLVDPAGFRILSPKKSPSFNKGYFQTTIDQMWTYYQTHDLTVVTIYGTYIGHSDGNLITFKNQGDGSVYNVDKPTSTDVIGSTGSIVSGDEKVKAIKAQISAMINRNVANNASQGVPSQYYQSAPANFYSQFWHAHSLNNLAYGFDYDDVFEQSTSLFDPNPRTMTINVTWG